MRINFTFGIATMCGVLACLSFHTLEAQVVTNQPALDKTFSLFRQNESTSYARALQLATQKNWPLVIKGQHGKYAVLSGVNDFGLPIYKAIDNLTSAQTVGTNTLWPGGTTGLNLTGNAANMNGKLGIWDGGAVRGTHVELRGRVVQEDSTSTLDDHATHVSGTMIATGINPQAKGMAFQAPLLRAWDFNNDLSEMTSAAPSLYLSNHSYGTIAGWDLDANNNWDWYGISGDTVDYQFGYYDSGAQGRDSIAYNAPYYLIVQAASNNRGETGPPVDSPYFGFNTQNQLVSMGKRPATLSSNAWFRTIPTYGNAKDILTIGAIEPIPNGYTQPSDVQGTYFSSWGPTSDGRIKPDIVADGDGVLSCISTSDVAYDTYAGTSMATPNVTGSLFLLQQYYSSLHHDTAMRSATLKALAIHTADQTGTSPGPNYIYGWGLMDTKNAAGVITSSVKDGSQQILETSLVGGTTDTIRIPVVASGKAPLKATIVWTDPPAAVDNVNNRFATDSKLINDLDLRIIKGSSVYMPWVLNPAKPANAATTGDNAVDNVEKVEAGNGIAGATYTIQITHKHSLIRGQQAFSLVYSGAGGSTYCTSGPTSSAGTRVDSVSVGGVHNKNNPGCTTYSDFTNLSATIQGGQTVPITIDLTSCDATTNQRVVKVYIDYNNDGNFTDAGDLVATSPVLAGGTTTYSTTFVTPSTLVPGTTTRMRIVAEETNNPAVVAPCGSYGNGETQDYSVTIGNPVNDLSMYSMADPLTTICGDSTQIVTLTIRNTGSVTQKGFPVSAKVLSGGATIATLTGTYPDTIGAGNSIVYTLPGNFNAQPGQTYQIVANVALTGDQNASNNTDTFTVIVSPPASQPTSGTADICTGSAILNVTNADSSNTYLWYTAPTGGSPIAAGYSTSSTTVANTYYFSSGGSGTFSPVNKTSLDTAGGYNAFYGNWISYSAAVPMTLEAARLYTRYGGTIAFIVADVDQASIQSNGSFNYLPYTTTTIHVYATSPHPQPPLASGATQTNDPADTGAVFYLNIPLPAGNHDIIIESLDSATIFRNDNIGGDVYPIGSPNQFAWTGNSAGVTSTSLGTTFEGYYYFFYDAKIKTADCSTTAARTAVTATQLAAPVIIQVGDSLISNVGTGNQWYFNGQAVQGATDSILAPKKAGTYEDIVSIGTCTQNSNAINFVLTAVDTVNAPKGLVVSPNPTSGLVNVNFTVSTSADLTLEVYDILGQQLYKQVNPAYIGTYSGQLNLGGYASGVYLLKITHGDNVTLVKVLLVH